MYEVTLAESAAERRGNRMANLRFVPLHVKRTVRHGSYARKRAHA
jgi:hypothetical protein